LEIVNQVKELNLFEKSVPNIKRFESVAELNNYRSNDTVLQKGLWGVVIFDTLTRESKEMSPTQLFQNLNYSLAVSFFETDTILSDDKYMKSGYIELQYILQNALSLLFIYLFIYF